MAEENVATDSTRGVWLALVTVLCWSLLPITLRIASRHLDPYTLTWYRFAVSALVLGVFLAATSGLPRISALRSVRPAALLLAATIGLVSNYVLYLVSLSYV